MRRFLTVFLAIVTLLLSAQAKDQYQRPGPIHRDRDGEKWAEKTLRKMSVEEKVGQLFMIWIRARFYNLQDPDLLQLEETIKRDHIGSLAMTVPVDGPFLIKTGPYEAAMALNEIQRASKLPLLIAADFERGVSMRLDGTTNFPHAMAFGAAGKLDYAESFGRITAQEARAIGVQWNFFPDADVNSNPANPIINTRSFGEDPQQVGDLVAAYIRGAKAGGMLTTAKHFPGHGDTATDSHLSVAKVSGDLARLQAVELPPFRKAIEAGVDAVMVAHVTAPALEPDPNKVGTTSSAIVTDLLKNQLGFKGLVVTDAIDMAGVTRLYANNIGRAAVDAFKAGNDLLLIPADLDASYKAMLEAVRSGEIPRQRVDASVLKLLKAKASLGLQKARLVDIQAIPKQVAQPADISMGQQVADDAVTLVRDNGKLLPLKRMGTVSSGLPYQAVEEIHNRVVAVILTEDLHSDAGRILARQLRMRVPDTNVIYVDPRTAAAELDSVLKVVDEAQAVIAAVFVIPTAGKVIQGPNGVTNSVALADATANLLQNVLNHAAEKTAVLAMGNPYLASDFPLVQNYICTFSNANVSEVSAVKALFGEIPIRGRLPVTIPNIAQRGAGIERQPAVSYGGPQHVQVSGH
ncbi:MAG TPA: glycoside hydrolase family 3 protein [Terriglobales bacterium]